MGKFRGVDADPGWIAREFKDIRRLLRELSAAKRIPGTTFPDGVIPATALASPTAPGFVNLTATNFPVATSVTYLISDVVAVPRGFTSCVINLTGRVAAPGSGSLASQVELDGITGNAIPSSGEGVPNVATFATVVTGLSEGVPMTLRLSAWSDADRPAGASNVADLTGSLVWFA